MKTVLLLAWCVHAVVRTRDYGPVQGIAARRSFYLPKGEAFSGESEALSSLDDSTISDDVIVPYETTQEKFNRSIVQGRLRANPSNFRAILMHEFNDISKELGNKLIGQIEQVQDTNYDRDKFKQVFVIRKHVVSDGKKRAVEIDVKEHMVPRENVDNAAKNDIGLHALLVWIVFLLAGLAFTMTIKMYQNAIGRSCFKKSQESVSET